MHAEDMELLVSAERGSFVKAVPVSHSVSAICLNRLYTWKLPKGHSSISFSFLLSQKVFERGSDYAAK